MPASNPEIPNYRERTALQFLRAGHWASTNEMHPTGATTLDKMVAKGWLEKHSANGLYRIKTLGLAALTRKISLEYRNAGVEKIERGRRTKIERDARKAAQAEEARLALIEHERAQRQLFENMERLRAARLAKGPGNI